MASLCNFTFQHLVRLFRFLHLPHSALRRPPLRLYKLPTSNMVCKRTPFYSTSLPISLNHTNLNSYITVVALFTSILQSVFGTLAGFVNGRSPLLREFALLPPIHPTLPPTPPCRLTSPPTIAYTKPNTPFLTDIFGKLAGALSIATWLWIGLLLLYNRRPQSSNPLSRSYAHCVSFGVLSVGWIGE